MRQVAERERRNVDGQGKTFISVCKLASLFMGFVFMTTLNTASDAMNTLLMPTELHVPFIDDILSENS